MSNWFVDEVLVADMINGLPFKPLERSKVRDPYIAKKYETYVTSSFNGASYVIIIFYKYQEDDNKNLLHIKVYSPKLEINKKFEVEKFQYGDHEKLKKLMKKVLLS